MRWYKHDPDAFLAGTRELTLEEIGAYILIIDLLYSRDGDVPDDDLFVARALGLPPQTWRRMHRALVAKGKVHAKSDGKLTANRVDLELVAAGKLIEKMSLLGKLSWEKRSSNNGPRSTARLSGTLKRHAYDNQIRDTSSFSSEPNPAREAPAEPPEAGGRRSALAPTSELEAVMQRKLGR